MQRLRIEPDDGALWIEPDPDGEFVRADEAQRQRERVTELEMFLTSLESSLRHLARSRQGTELRRIATEIRTLLDK
jgi:hypothetical protein